MVSGARRMASDCPPPSTGLDPDKRVKYSLGLVLGVDEFEQEQHYLLGRGRQHNRALHGYGHRSASWTFANDRGGWRLDHVLLEGLRPVAAEYAHDWRSTGLSDHSALLVDAELAAG